MNSILEARNVSFAYGPAKWAIHGSQFFVGATPERVALLGSNGVGKSTLMLMLNGTLRPQEGELFVLGQPIDYSRAGLHKLRREVGMVLQDLSPFLTQPVSRNSTRNFRHGNKLQIQ